MLLLSPLALFNASSSPCGDFLHLSSSFLYRKSFSPDLFRHTGSFANGVFTLDYDGDGTYTAADKNFQYLTYGAGDRPVTGDWNGDGHTKVGIYRNGFWILDLDGNGVYDYPLDRFYAFGGNTGEVPLIGDWNGDGRSKLGYYLSGFWALDYNGNGTFDGTGAGQDRFTGFGGNPGEQPMIGRW